MVALNVCPTDVAISLDGVIDGAAPASVTTYSGLDVGGWVLADRIGSLDSPPWRNGPLTPHVSGAAPTSLARLSLSLMVFGTGC